MTSAPVRRDLVILLALILIYVPRKGVCIHVDRVIVPPLVVAGESAELRCLYKQEDDELYSLKWWRGDDQFYQYIPPRRSSYSISGVRVNMSATISVNKHTPSGLEVVVLDAVGLDTAGVFRCEVMTDRIFETVFKEANMTVLVSPSGPPVISGEEKVQNPITQGQRISLMCSVPPATPAPTIAWRINRHPIRNSDWVTSRPLLASGDLAQVMSTLNFVVTSKMLRESIQGLVIECHARQPGSAYSSHDALVLTPERTSYFWYFFSRGSISASPSWLTYGLCGLLSRIWWSNI